MIFIYAWLRKRIKSFIATELSALSHYFDHLIEVLPSIYSDQQILHEAHNEKKHTIGQIDELGTIIQEDSLALLLLDGVFNHHTDIHQLLKDVKPFLNRGSRLYVAAYNPYFKWLYQLAHFGGMRKADVPKTFLTKTDLQNVTQLTGYSIVHIKGVGYFPFALFGIGNVINGLLSLIPLVRQLSLVQTILLRPNIPEREHLSLSVVIPARNERGNIESAIKKLQHWNKSSLEVIFVEGHSTDGTWEEILRVQEQYQTEFSAIQALCQTGKGKNDAVRLGFKQATGDLLTILDADLTVAPEFLERFYDAYHDGHGDFINGNRLLYAMEKDAMRFLNQLGNVFFAKALSVVLDTHIGDSLCGTKLFSRRDYQRFVTWRERFGDFDPFGDFELLFPASVLGLDIVNIPIPYRARTYGSTNISRFRDGLALFKMTAIGLFRIRMNLFANH